MTTPFLKYYKTLSFICGCLSVAALPPHYCFPVLFVTFGILAVLLARASDGRRAFAGGYWFGFGFFACGFFWINNALLLDLPRLGWLIPLSFFGSGAFFGLFVAFPAFLSHYCKNSYGKILSFAVWWTVFEWIRSFIFTGFPWNLLGSVLAFNDAGIQLASVIGTYGLSLLTIVFVSLPSAFFVDNDRKRAIIVNGAALPLLAAAIWGFGCWRLHRLPDNEFSSIRVRIVQPSIPQQIKWQPEALVDNLNTYIELSRQELPSDTKLVIWGETANTFSPVLEPQYLESLALAVPPGGYLITGSIDYAFNDAVNRWQPLNSMIALDGKQQVVANYDKSHLVPFGEYIPFRRWLPGKLRTVTNFISDFGAGNGVETIRLPGVPPFGVLICYEVIFPAEVVNRADRPQWLINLTNDGWYGISAGPYQHLVAARLRAAEEGLTMVRAANSGISALISKTGTILEEFPLQKSGQFDFYLPQALSVHTVYGKYHNFITIMLCSLILISIFLCGRKPK